MRILAALSEIPRQRRALRFAALAGIVLLATTATAIRAADPTSPPATSPVTEPSCADRYPEPGPAGLDLRLGCLIGELVGHYTGSVGADATPASSYGLVVLGVLVAIAVGIWLIGRVLGRAAGRRLAPVQPGEWWLCATCRSVNAAGVAHCYSCGAPRPDGPTLRTDDAPATTQSFGSKRKRG